MEYKEQFDSHDLKNNEENEYERDLIDPTISVEQKIKKFQSAIQGNREAHDDLAAKIQKMQSAQEVLMQSSEKIAQKITILQEQHMTRDN